MPSKVDSLHAQLPDSSRFPELPLEERADREDPLRVCTPGPHQGGVGADLDAQADRVGSDQAAVAQGTNQGREPDLQVS